MGANIHVCKDLNLIESFALIEKDVHVAGPYKTLSYGIGKVTLPTALKDGRFGAYLTLTTVHYLPESPANLISISLLVKKMIFWNSETYVLQHGGRTVGYTPKSSNELYPLLLHRAWPSTAFMTNMKRLPLDVWHQRLGHLNYASLRTYLSGQGIIWVENDPPHCRPCALSNAKKVYNRATKRRSDQLFHTVFTDLVGPIKPEGFQKERYYIVFIDDYSRYQTTYTLRSKTEWLACFIEHYNWVETHFKTKIATLRTDYDSVVRLRAFEDFLSGYGIEFEPAPADGQDMNGVAEAGQRTLMSMVRSIAIGGNIPDFLWPDLVLAGTHIKNRRPTAALQGKTPYELVHHSKPDLNHLRILGSTVYVLIQDGSKVQSEKVSPRAREGILIGFDGDSICRVWIPSTERIERTKDHAIYEDVLSTKDASDISTSSTPEATATELV